MPEPITTAPIATTPLPAATSQLPVAKSPLPTAEEAFGANLPTAEEAFGPAVSSKPMSGSFWDGLFSSTSLARAMNAFSQGSDDNWGGSDGWNGQADAFLQKAGVYNTYNDSKANLIKSANEAWMRPTIAALGAIADIPKHITNYIGEAGQALLSSTQGTSKFNPARTVAGTLGESMIDLASGAGMELGGEIHPAESTVDSAPFVKARSEGIIGEGETGYFNAAPVSKENLEARSQAAQSINEVPPKSPTEPYSIDDVARQINPDAFAKLDSLQADQARIRQDIQNRTNSLSDQRAVMQGTAPLNAGKNDEWLLNTIAKSQQKLQESDFATRDLIPALAQARQSAHEALYGDSEYSSSYRDYLQSQLLEKALQEGPVQDAYDHANSLIPEDYRQELINKVAGTNKPEPIIKGGSAPQEALSEPLETQSRLLGSSQTARPGVAGTTLPENSESSARTPERPLKAKGFTTSRGSTYKINEDGTTTRNKAARSDIGHEGQEGPQPRSEHTFYVSKEHANELGLFQARGVNGKMAIQERQDGTAGVKYVDGPHAGKFEKRTVQKAYKEPAPELIPVETWKDGTRVHFGNEITSIEDGTQPILSQSLKETQGTGELKPYGGSKAIEAQAVEKGLVDSFGDDIPLRRRVDFKEEAQKVSDLMNSTDRDVLKRMALGQADVPAGINQRFLANALIKNSEDPKFLRQMANAPITKELSEHALQMRIAGELDETDPVSIMRDIQDYNKKAAGKRSGYFRQKPGLDAEAIKANIEDHVNTAREQFKPDIKSFLTSIECDY